MKLPRFRPLLLAMAVLTSAHAWSQPMEHAHAEAKPWSFGASLSWYFVHDRNNFGVVTATADHGPVHLEARYNYEALKTDPPSSGGTSSSARP